MRLLPLFLLCTWLVSCVVCTEMDDKIGVATIGNGKQCPFFMCKTCSGKCVRSGVAACLVSPCASNPCAKDEKCIDNFCGGCNACCLKRKPTCLPGYRTCPDGSKVYRDPANNCRYAKCECHPKEWTREGHTNSYKCKTLSFKCKPKYTKWSNRGCGCGCRPVGKEECKNDVQVCPDGSNVVRDPENNCMFPKCDCRTPRGWTHEGGPDDDKCKKQTFKCKPGFGKWSNGFCGCGCKPTKKCKADFGVCPDGSRVVRDPEKNCRFPLCKCPPEGWTREGNPRDDKCKKQTFKCEPGYEKWSHSYCGCGCKPARKCNDDVQVCPDGSKVYRDLKNKCQFPKCECPPKGWTREGAPNSYECKKLGFECKSGYEQWSNDDCGCGCKPGRKGCKDDMRECPDGSKVVRDPENNCEFPKCECPPKGWTREGRPDDDKCKKLSFECKPYQEKWSHDDCGCGCKSNGCREGFRTCPDGSKVVRDPEDKCRFGKCDCKPTGWTILGGPRKCEDLKYVCKPGYVRWLHDRCGCGCRPVGKKECKDDIRKCPDGSRVYRDPANKCQFPKCECPPKGWTREGAPDDEKCKRPTFRCKPGYEQWSNYDCGCGCKPARKCKDDAKVCSDGSRVYRDPKNNCQFPRCECPPKDRTHERRSNSLICKNLKCKSGYEKWSHDDCGCGCKPVKKECKDDMHECPDGTTVVRDPENNCMFPKCECPPKGWTHEGRPDSYECKKNSFECKPGYEKWSHDDCGCGCKPGSCREGFRTCPDGSKVYRDPEDKCRFGKCECKPTGWTIEGGPRKCKDLKYYCKPGFEKWSHDMCGCGCKPGTRR